MIAALYVLENGPYYDLPGVDPWAEDRDARLYAGPHPVVAHPPCERWGRYWDGGPAVKVKRKLGDDNGCFAAALDSVRTWGGVLEHPEGSHAWKHFGLTKPPRSGGWIEAGDGIGKTCCVAQGHYGHPAQKLTWLYAAHVPDLPELTWGPKPRYIDPSEYNSEEERKRMVKTGICQRLSKRQRATTPDKFRDLLINIAEKAELQIVIFPHLG